MRLAMALSAQTLPLSHRILLALQCPVLTACPHKFALLRLPGCVLQSQITGLCSLRTHRIQVHFHMLSKNVCVHWLRNSSLFSRVRCLPSYKLSFPLVYLLLAFLPINLTTRNSVLSARNSLGKNIYSRIAMAYCSTRSRMLSTGTH